MVYLVRSEDRKPSRRVFPLLQNLDLDTVTFANVQGVGDPITIEDMNEQEMVDLIIVNLARLAVAGEWTGLLEAGGGGGINLPEQGTTNEDEFLISSSPIWGTTGPGDGSEAISALAKCLGFPFIAPFSGTISACTIQVATAAAGKTCYIGFYNEDTTYFYPGSLLGYADVSVASTGNARQTVFSSTITLVKGETYWYSLNVSASSTTAVLQSVDTTYLPSLGISNGVTETAVALYAGGMTDYATPPSTFSPTSNWGGFGRPLLTIEQT